jgi:hypothetical protein
MTDCIKKITTKTGLKVHALRLPQHFSKGVSVSKDDMDTLDLERDAFASNWNYALRAQKSTNN